MERYLAGICNYSVWAERLAFRGHIPTPPPPSLVRHSSLPPVRLLAGTSTKEVRISFLTKL